jgi:hypothetical protein
MDNVLNLLRKQIRQEEASLNYFSDILKNSNCEFAKRQANGNVPSGITRINNLRKAINIIENTNKQE